MKNDYLLVLLQPNFPPPEGFFVGFLHFLKTYANITIHIIINYTCMQRYETQHTSTTAETLDIHIKNGGLKGRDNLRTVQRKLNDLGHDS